MIGVGAIGIEGSFGNQALLNPGYLAQHVPGYDFETGMINRYRGSADKSENKPSEGGFFTGLINRLTGRGGDQQDQEAKPSTGYSGGQSSGGGSSSRFLLLL